jgi:hypothetical protein
VGFLNPRVKGSSAARIARALSIAFDARLRLEYCQDVDVTVRPGLSSGLGSEEYHGVQPMAVG